ncbi:MAG: AAA family ATPase, partial [Synechococcus sp. SB0672_bin_10]|nr:AAA family ATPase [Synechococcus sp. SB0672_bin_10]
MPQLDDSQRAFCEAPENNNIRLLAPAGCGKTLCLLHRCKYLASQKPDERIRFLIVTFTRAAEQELSARLRDDTEFASLKESAGKTSVEVTTLNAWGWKRLRNKVPSYS